VVVVVVVEMSHGGDGSAEPKRQDMVAYEMASRSDGACVWMWWRVAVVVHVNASPRVEVTTHWCMYSARAFVISIGSVWVSSDHHARC
jgi:hypothetical protein